MSGFVDRAQLHAKGGDGGAGSVSFRREAHVDRGGPDGGDGGHGGSVWLVATTNQASLLSFRDHPFRKAASGSHGQGKRKHGSSGEDLVVAVPVGTTISTLDGQLVCDLAAVGDRFCAAEGGHGGHGNARFLSNRRRAPSFAEQGERGEERWCDLELKLAADVALIGYPNVGKSTLISRVSAARPKVADYPFTTLVPHLGVVRVGARAARPDDATEFVMADVPGLIEGAAEGRGLGHEFLRHVERARVLCVLLDLSEAAPVPPDRQLEVLRAELVAYLPELASRPTIVVGSKCDVAVDAPIDAAVELEISAVRGDGLDPLLERLAVLVVEARALEASPTDAAEPRVHRPAPDEVVVERAHDGSFTVLGRAAARAVALSDTTDDEAIDELRRRLERLGIDRALARAGATDGDVVHVGAMTFEWWHGEGPPIDIPVRRPTRAERAARRAKPHADG